MRVRCSWLLVLLAVAVIESGALADVVYTTIGPGPGGSLGQTFPSSGGIFFFSGQTHAARFTTPAGPGWVLDSIDLAAEFILPTGAVPRVSLFSDSPSMLVNVTSGGPSDVLDMTSAVSAMGDVAVADFDGAALLQAETSYWVAVTVVSGGGVIWHNSFDFVGQGLSSSTTGFGPWSVAEPFPAIARGFRINATLVPAPTPEPYGLWLMILGAAVVALRRRTFAR